MAVGRTELPSDDDLAAALSALRISNATLGAAKLHAALLNAHPSWSVSEKRARKILQSAGLSLSAPVGASTTLVQKGKNGRLYPRSQRTAGLDIAALTTKVEVKDFGPGKGKGLVATVPIAEGEVVWKEDPWVLAPEWELYDLQQNGAACAHCSTPFASQPVAGASVPCAFSTSSASFCPARFCNRLCAGRAATHHPLLCAARHPPGAHALAHARTSEWIALHGAVRAYARLLLAYDGAKTWDADWGVWAGLACLSMEERTQDPYWETNREPDHKAWHAAHAVVLDAFAPADADADRKLGKLLKRRLPEHVARELFSYDGFLRALGKMNLNQEAHGGVYALHSHVNHSCTPALSVRHRDQRSALARITVSALRALAPGDELTITYVDPALRVRARRRELAMWGFGACMCTRCVAEAGEAGAEGEDDDGDARARADMEREIKSGLGLM